MDYPCVSNIQTNYRGSFRIVRLIARISKYDFWNPEEILNWHRWKYFLKTYFFKTKKFFGKFWKYFQIFFWQKNQNFEKSKFWKFQNFGRFLKFQNFEIPKFWFFKILIFCQKKIWNIFKFFSRTFFGLEKICFQKIFSPMSIQNFFRIPKIVLRKSCDEPNYAKTSTIVCLYIWNTRIIHLITSSKPPLPWGPQAGSEVMEHYFSQSARENMNCSSR